MASKNLYGCNSRGVANWFKINYKFCGNDNCFRIDYNILFNYKFYMKLIISETKL